MSDDIITIRRNNFLKMSKQFAAVLDNLVKPVVESVGSHLINDGTMSDKKTVKTQTDVYEFVDLASGDATSLIRYLDVLSTSCAANSRPYLQSLRSDIEVLDTEVRSLSKKFSELLPTLDAMVPSVGDQALLIKDAAYILKHLDVVTRTKSAPWYKYKELYTEEELSIFRKQSAELSQGEDDDDEDEATPNSQEVYEKDTIGDEEEFTSDKNPTAEQGVSETPPVESVDPDSPRPLQIDTDRDDEDSQEDEQQNNKATDSDQLTQDIGLKENPDPDVAGMDPETDNYVVKQCSVESCDYSVDFTSNRSFAGHFAKYHLGIYKVKKWTLKDINSSTYKAIKEKWFSNE
uniref:Uncharacterized protein n=1 Tax=Tetranychus urticae TaxID=32264 RepID=T1L5U6_TETUR